MSESMKKTPEKKSNSAKIQSKSKDKSIINKFKRYKKRKITLISIFLLVFLLVIMLLLFLFQLEIIKNPYAKFGAKPILFKIRDECSLIVGQLIHTYNDEGSCKNRCNAECEVRNFNFYNVEFIEKEKDCHECNCYCR